MAWPMAEGLPCQVQVNLQGTSVGRQQRPCLEKIQPHVHPWLLLLPSSKNPRMSLLPWFGPSSHEPCPRVPILCLANDGEMDQWLSAGGSLNTVLVHGSALSQSWSQVLTPHWMRRAPQCMCPSWGPCELRSVTAVMWQKAAGVVGTAGPVGKQRGAACAPGRVACNPKSPTFPRNSVSSLSTFTDSLPTQRATS